MMRKGLSLIVSVLILMICTVGVCFGTAFAEDEDGTITLSCQVQEAGLEGMKWHLYKVGIRTSEKYVFQGNFEKYSIALGDQKKSMNEWSAEELSDAAETLRAYTIADKIPYIAEGVTDANGNIKFDELENGLYLAVGEEMRKSVTYYTASAVFIEVNNAADGNVTAFPKIIASKRFPGSELGESEVYVIKKIWKNNASQPKDKDIVIIADIYCDNVFYGSAELSADNNWEYRWETDEYHEWFVIEREIPESYVVIYKKNERQYLIVNTYLEVHRDEDIVTSTIVVGGSSETYTTSVTGTSQITSSSVSDTSTSFSDSSSDSNTSTSPSDSSSGSNDKTSDSGSTSSSSGGKLPQTGQLWWPVPIMGACGILLIGIGRKIGKKDD